MAGSSSRAISSVPGFLRTVPQFSVWPLGLLYDTQAGFQEELSKRRESKLPNQMSAIPRIGQHHFCYILLVKAVAGPVM